MNEYVIDFNDAIYRETGICAESVAMRWADMKSDDGYIYRFSVVKRHTKMDIDYFISLKDPLGNAVKDLRITVDGKMFGIDQTKSQDAVMIEQKIDSKPLGIILVESVQEKLKAHLKIKLEKPLSSSPSSRNIKKKVVLKKSRSI